MNKSSIILICLMLVGSITFHVDGQNTGKKQSASGPRKKKNLRLAPQQANQKSGKAGRKPPAKKRASNKRKKAPPKKRPTKTTKLPEPTPGGALIHVRPVDPSLKSEVIASAARIDQLINSQLASAGQTANPDSSDQLFVRRMYLEITGTIPTARQTFAFLNSDNADKRSILIDYLLNQPGYASHFYNYWADVLRIKDKSGPVTYTRPWGDWLKQSLRQNTPFDKNGLRNADCGRQKRGRARQSATNFAIEECRWITWPTPYVSS